MKVEFVYIFCCIKASLDSLAVSIGPRNKPEVLLHIIAQCVNLQVSMVTVLSSSADGHLLNKPSRVVSKLMPDKLSELKAASFFYNYGTKLFPQLTPTWRIIRLFFIHILHLHGSFRKSTPVRLSVQVLVK